MRLDDTEPYAAKRPDESGSVLMWALMFTIIASGMIISHTTFLAANRREMNVRYEHVTLADNFARSGLTDALTWLQRQPSQPVQAFAPQYDPTGDPPLEDTIDPTIGLVREFEVRGNLWARYEVRTGEVFDVSSERGIDTPGSVWDVGSRGFLFVKSDESKGFDEAPNRVVATNYLCSEMRGIAILPPAQAAVTTEQPAHLDLGPMALIDGNGGTGLAFPDSTALVGAPPPNIVGTPAVASIVAYAAEPKQVFSMHMDALKSVSDYTIDLGETEAVQTRDEDAGSLIDDVLDLIPIIGSGGDGGFPQDPVETEDAEQQGTWEWWERNALSADSTEKAWDWWTNMVDPTDSLTSTVEVTRLEADTVLSKIANEFRWSEPKARYAAGVGQTGDSLCRDSALATKAVFIEGWDTDGDGDKEVILDDTRPMEGRGLIIVQGDLIVTDTNVSRLQGVLYVTGNAVIDGDFQLEGMLIVRGSLRMGYGTNPSVVKYDANMIGLLKKAMERYRMSRSIRPGWAR